MTVPTLARSEVGTQSGTSGAGAPHSSRIRRIMIYGASRSVVEALLGVRTLLLAQLLGPAAFGGWTLFRIAARYALFGGLGVQRGLEFHVVRSRTETKPSAEAEAFARAALGFLLLTSSGLAVVSLTASFFVASDRSAIWLRALAAAVVAEQLWVYGLVYLRAQGGLKRYAVLETIAAAVHLLLTVTLAWRWGLPGALVGFALAAFGVLGMLSRHVPLRPAVSLDRVRSLLRVGLPLLLVTVVTTLLATADRLVVAAVGGATMLGYYAFAVSIGGLAGVLAWVVRTVVLPEVYASAHTDGANSAVRSHLERTLLPYAWFYAPLLGAFAFGLGPAILLLLPQYAEAIAPARIFVFKGALAGLSVLASLGVVAATRQRALPWFSLLALAVNVAASFSALHFGAGLQGVAASALLSQFLYDALALWLVANTAGVKAPWRLVCSTLWPTVWCLGAVVTIGWLLPGADLPTGIAGLALYILLLLVLLPGMRRVLRLARHGWSEAAA
jgi:O-antigen/teichoic acid export membrane protein